MKQVQICYDICTPGSRFTCNWLVEVLIILLSAHIKDPTLNNLVFTLSHTKYDIYIFHVLVGPEKPRTLTPEWQADAVELAKKRRSNPISGISSKQ